MHLALFDFDGTVTSSDTWTPFMRFAVGPARMRVGRALLSPVVVGYRLGMVSSSRGRQIAARIGFQGEEAAAVRQLGIEYATTVLPRTERQSALERIEWHKVQGDDVVVVSASLDVYLGPWCERHGLDYICTTLEQRGARLTGRYLQGDCSGAGRKCDGSGSDINSLGMRAYTLTATALRTGKCWNLRIRSTTAGEKSPAGTT